jgi:hypothetical protein
MPAFQPLRTLSVIRGAATVVGTARALLLMLLGPPLVLLFWAHGVRPTYSGLDWPAIILAGLLGLAGLAAAPWRSSPKIVVAFVYSLLLIAALPFVGLLAVCSTGDCL